MVHDDNVKRSLWKLAVVEEVIRSRDGQVRGAIIKCSALGGRANRLHRPVQKLYPVELCHPTASPTPPEASTLAPETTSSRPTRVSAQRAAATRNLIDSGRL